MLEHFSMGLSLVPPRAVIAADIDSVKTLISISSGMERMEGLEGVLAEACKSSEAVVSNCVVGWPFSLVSLPDEGGNGYSFSVQAHLRVSLSRL